MQCDRPTTDDSGSKPLFTKQTRQTINTDTPGFKLFTKLLTVV